MGYIVSQALIFFMFATTLIPAMLTCEAADNGELQDWMVVTGLRVGMSVWSGWLTVASILSLSIFLKYLGMSTANGWNEEFWTCALLWIAFSLFAVTAYLNNDFVYGLVLVWAGLGIRAENVLESDAVEMSLNIILPAMSAIDMYIAFA